MTELRTQKKICLVKTQEGLSRQSPSGTLKKLRSRFSKQLIISNKKRPSSTPQFIKFVPTLLSSAEHRKRTQNYISFELLKSTSHMNSLKMWK